MVLHFTPNSVCIIWKVNYMCCPCVTHLTPLRYLGTKFPSHSVSLKQFLSPISTVTLKCLMCVFRLAGISSNPRVSPKEHLPNLFCIGYWPISLQLIQHKQSFQWATNRKIAFYRSSNLNRVFLLGCLLADWVNGRSRYQTAVQKYVHGWQ